MAQITQLVQLVFYTGPTLVLAGADFLPFVNSIYCTGMNGRSWASYRPGSKLNAFESLVSGQGYIVQSNQAGYEILETYPVAVLTVAGLGLTSDPDLLPAS